MRRPEATPVVHTKFDRDLNLGGIYEIARFCSSSSGGVFALGSKAQRPRNSISLGARFLALANRPLFWRSYRRRGEFERPHLRVLSCEYNWARLWCSRCAVARIRFR